MCPKKSWTAYHVFHVDARKQLRKTLPKLGFGATSKLIGQMWRNLSKAEQNVYAKKAMEENTGKPAVPPKTTKETPPVEGTVESGETSSANSENSVQTSPFPVTFVKLDAPQLMSNQLPSKDEEVVADKTEEAQFAAVVKGYTTLTTSASTSVTNTSESKEEEVAPVATSVTAVKSPNISYITVQPNVPLTSLNTTVTSEAALNHTASSATLENSPGGSSDSRIPLAVSSKAVPNSTCTVATAVNSTVTTTSSRNVVLPSSLPSIVMASTNSTTLAATPNVFPTSAISSSGIKFIAPLKFPIGQHSQARFSLVPVKSEGGVIRPMNFVPLPPNQRFILQPVQQMAGGGTLLKMQPASIQSATTQPLPAQPLPAVMASTPSDSANVQNTKVVHLAPNGKTPANPIPVIPAMKSSTVYSFANQPFAFEKLKRPLGDPSSSSSEPPAKVQAVSGLKTSQPIRIHPLPTSATFTVGSAASTTPQIRLQTLPSPSALQTACSFRIPPLETSSAPPVVTIQPLSAPAKPLSAVTTPSTITVVTVSPSTIPQTVLTPSTTPKTVLTTSTKLMTLLAPIKLPAGPVSTALKGKNPKSSVDRPSQPTLNTQTVTSVSAPVSSSTASSEGQKEKNNKSDGDGNTQPPQAVSHGKKTSSQLAKGQTQEPKPKGPVSDICSFQLPNQKGVRVAFKAKTPTDKRALKRKAQQAPENPVYTCNHCMIAFTNDSELKEHFLTRHCGDDDEEPVFTCHFCNDSYPSKSLLTAHMVKRHGHRGLVSVYDNRSQPILHSLRSTNEPSSPANGTDESKDPVVPTQTSSFATAVVHYPQNKTGDKKPAKPVPRSDDKNSPATPLECVCCRKEFPDKRTLYIHKLKKHVDIFNPSESMSVDRHQAVELQVLDQEGFSQTVEKNVVHKTVFCLSCGFPCKSNSELGLHIYNKHEGRYPCPGTDCGRLFRERRCLKMHIGSKHPKFRAYSCRFCQFCTYQQLGILRHLDGHPQKPKPDPKPVQETTPDIIEVVQETVKQEVIDVEDYNTNVPVTESQPVPTNLVHNNSSEQCGNVTPVDDGNFGKPYVYIERLDGIKTEDVPFGEQTESPMEEESQDSYEDDDDSSDFSSPSPRPVRLFKSKAPPTFRCLDCKKTFPSREMLSSHFPTCGSNQDVEMPEPPAPTVTPQPPVPSLVCNLCFKKFRTVQAMKSHRRSVHFKHSALDKLTCKACESSFSQKAHLIAHLKVCPEINT